MTEKDFDKRLKEIADSYTETPNESAWDAIASRKAVAAQKTATTQNIIATEEKRVTLFSKRVKYLSFAATIAAAVILLFILLPLEHPSEINLESPIKNIPTAVNAPIAANFSTTPKTGTFAVQKAQLKSEITLANSERVADIANNSADTAKQEVSNNKYVADNTSLEKSENNRSESNKKIDPQDVDSREIDSKKIYRYIPQEEVTDKKIRRFAIAASSDMSAPGSGGTKKSAFMNDLAGSIFPEFSYDRSIYEKSRDFTHSIPLSFGVQLQYKLNNRFAITSGINYTMLKSTFSTSQYAENYTVKQSLHYIGVPVGAKFFFAKSGRLNFYINGGATFEKCVAAQFSLRSQTTNEDYTESVKPIAVSIYGGVGAEYMFGRQFGLYFDPGFSYFFDTNQPRSIRTERPFNFKVEIGFRIHL